MTTVHGLRVTTPDCIAQHGMTSAAPVRRWENNVITNNLGCVLQQHVVTHLYIGSAWNFRLIGKDHILKG